jgi:cysteine desulfurase
MRRIYLDHNATTPIDPLVLETMTAVLRDTFGNPSSVHWYGQIARAVVEEARENVARLLECTSAEVVFTSGGTEADNMALRGAAQASNAPRRKILISGIEHHAVLHDAHALAEQRFPVETIRVGSDGVVDLEDLKRRLDKNTAIVALMLANNETGIIQPVTSAARMAREHGAVVFCDAVQAVGKMAVGVEELGVDLLALSGHKIYGPKGVGALYIRRGTAIRSLIRGGGQERSRRAGTENVAAIAGLGRAAVLARTRLDEDAYRISQLRDMLEARLLSIPGAVRNGSGPCLPNTINLAFDGIEAESLVMALDLAGIAVSTGAACSVGAVEPSHVLRAMGLPLAQVKASIRLSLGRNTTQADIERTAEAVADAVMRQRRGLEKSRDIRRKRAPGRIRR